MDAMWDFSLGPTPEGFRTICGSGKFKNLFADIFDPWRAAVIISTREQSEWESVRTGIAPENFVALARRHEQDKVDVLSKLIAAPRLPLLHKAWGLFYSTGQLEYLRAAFEVGGNRRARQELKNAAVDIFHQVRSYYTEYYEKQRLAVQSPCLSTFLAFEGELMRQQQKLIELERGEGRLTVEDIMRKDKESKAELDSILGRLGIGETEENKRKKQESEMAEAEAVFDAIVQRVFTKIK
jgi:hypothetical protein